LLSQHQQQRLPHALLLSGVAGLGKLAFAQQFAQYLLCKTVGVDQPCGQCPGCHLVLAGNHPDLLNLFPEETGKNIKIDQIREMITVVSQTTQRAGYRAVIIAPAESLNKAAANALLKTLEEPAGKTVLLLVSHQAGALPATVTSRCQPIQFAGTMDANAWLSARLKELHQPDQAQLLLKIAEYAPLRALALAQNRYLPMRDQLLANLQAYSQRQAPLLAMVTDYLKQDLVMWVEAFISLLTDILRLQLGVQLQWIVNQDCLGSLQQLSSAYPASRISPLLSRLGQARQSLLSTQVHLNDQLLLESILIQFADMNVR